MPERRRIDLAPREPSQPAEKLESEKQKRIVLEIGAGAVPAPVKGEWPSAPFDLYIAGDRHADTLSLLATENLEKLAEIAESQGDLEEAIEYYQQAVVINDSLSPRFVHLAELLLRVGQPLVAREAIEAAVELEPQNPKYLDLLTETAILCQDKTLALKVYSTLCLVNPENKKLPDLKQRIDLL